MLVSKLYFLAAFAAISVSGAWSYEFESDADRIVGGEYAKKDQFPYQIAIRIRRPVFDTELQANVTRYFHLCGGSILSERWTLSTAYCTKGKAANKLVVVVAAHHVFNDGITYPVAKYILHPEKGHTDLSLLMTRWAIQFNNHVQPIDISHTRIVGREAVIVSGWGFDENDTYAKYLRFIKTNTLTNNDCVKRLGKKNGANINDDHVCTYKNKSSGLCAGDSGAPLVNNKRLIGVFSWSVSCGKDNPDVFLRISSYADWIESVITNAALN